MRQMLEFLIGAAADFFCILFLLRFYMQARRVSFSGPLGNFVVQMTNWLVQPLRRVLPGFYGYDMASMAGAWLTQLGLLVIVFGLRGYWTADVAMVDMAGPHSYAPSLIDLFVGSVRLTARAFVNLLIGALILQAILSWVNPYSPISQPVHQISEPILAPIRRVLPLIGNIDLSPLVAIVLLQALLMLL